MVSELSGTAGSGVLVDVKPHNDTDGTSSIDRVKIDF